MAMDVPRNPSFKRNRLIKRITYVVLGLIAATGITLGVTRLQPAAPTVEWSTIWPDRVHQGPMIRDVRGTGTLVPIDMMYIPAESAGRVERIFIRPGTPVSGDSVILSLNNPELQNDAVTAEYNLKQAEAAYTDLKVQLQSTSFDKQAAAAQVDSDYRQAKLKADRDQKLSEAGLIPDVDLKLSTTQAEELAQRDDIEKQRLKIIDQSAKAQLDAQQVKIDQLKALYALKQEEVAKLNVRAGVAGVLEALPVEVGQQVAAGATLAQVTQPSRLKAQLKITETDAKYVLNGQKASIDTHSESGNGIIPGHVIRIDPAAVNGSVLVDVGLDAPLPQGARPDQSVDGTIELEHLASVLQVGRPTVGQPNTTISLFKISPDQKTGSRVTVRLGRASVNSIEVLSGLQAGDQVVLSDMNNWDKYDRIRFNH
jgi:HlyD family secretion protein